MSPPLVQRVDRCRIIAIGVSFSDEVAIMVHGSAAGPRSEAIPPNLAGCIGHLIGGAKQLVRQQFGRPPCCSGQQFC